MGLIHAVMKLSVSMQTPEDYLIFVNVAPSFTSSSSLVLGFGKGSPSITVVISSDLRL